MPEIAAIIMITLYDTAAIRLKLSHKNPNTTLATKNSFLLRHYTDHMRFLSIQREHTSE
jgi:hypothetical protein